MQNTLSYKCNIGILLYDYKISSTFIRSTKGLPFDFIYDFICTRTTYIALYAYMLHFYNHKCNNKT